MVRGVGIIGLVVLLCIINYWTSTLAGWERRSKRMAKLALLVNFWLVCTVRREQRPVHLAFFVASIALVVALDCVPQITEAWRS